jgi:putative Ig domain-containing protein
MTISRITAQLCLSVLISASPAMAATIAVPAGGNLQQAITNAQPGDTIALTPGATYTGTFTLPNKSGDAPITIRTAGDAGLPGDGGRISPANAAALAKIRSGSSSPAVQTAPNAHHWRLLLLEIQANASGTGDIMTLGDGSTAQRSLSQIPHDLVVDRVYLHGDAAQGQKRGIALNSASTTITGSYVSDIKAVGQDSQAIGGWNGPGPYTITNNYLEAAAENLMFGGADPAVPNLVPSDITIADNQFAKQTAWRKENWVVKNLIELKNARRVTIVRNSFEYNWQGGQSGFAVLFTVRNQDGNCPWCQVDHVTFQQNLVRHSAAGIQILGYDNNHPSQQTQAIVIRNNVFADIDSNNWGGNGYFLSLTGGARDITIDHNTIVQDHASGIIQADGAPVLGFTFTNNVAKHNSYGIIGSDHGVGNDSISAYLPASNITRNVIAGGSAGQYPGGNSFPTAAQFEAQFLAYAAGDYRLSAASAWRGAGTDGRDLGALYDQPIGNGGSTGAPAAPRVELHVGTELPGGALGSPYTGSLTVSGGQGPYMWAVASGALPPGLSLDPSSGTIAGEPRAYGSFAFGVSVTDVPSHVQATASATLIVAPKPVTITTVALPDARVGDAYSASLAASDGAAPLRWMMVVGTVPPGLTFDPVTGAITGTPRYPGNVQFTASVSDSWTPPMSATRTFTITTILEARPPKPDGSF